MLGREGWIIKGLLRPLAGSLRFESGFPRGYDRPTSLQGSDMIVQYLGDIVREADERFGLGRKARALVLLSVESLFKEDAGGCSGFLARLREIGLSEALDNWLNPRMNLALPDSDWVDPVVGPSRVAEIGRELGLANGRVRMALAYVLPALIRFFAKAGGLPDALPERFVQELRQFSLQNPKTPPRPAPRRKGSRSETSIGFGRWFWALGSLGLVLSGFYLGKQTLFGKHSPLSSPPAEAPLEGSVEPAAEAPLKVAEKKTDEPIQNLVPSARLVIRRIGDQIEFIGFLDSEATRTLVLEKLGKFFGSSAMSGDLLVEPLRKGAPWLAQLDRILPLFNVPGIDVRLEGNTVRVGGWVTEEDRAGILNSLMSVLGSEYRFGYLREEWTERTQDARQFLLARLSNVSPDLRVQDLIPILNRWVIHFEEGSAVFPPESLDLSVRIVEVLKSLKQTALIEVQLRGAGSGAVLQRLVNERADAIREALIKAGWPATLIKASGRVEGKPQGSANVLMTPLDRIEFRVIQVCDPLFPCEITARPKRPTPVEESVPSRPDSLGEKEKSSLPARELARSDSHQGVSSAGTPDVGLAPKPQEPNGVKPGEVVPDDLGDSGGSRLKALSENLPPPRPKQRPAPKPNPKPAKEAEWYDPLGIF